MSSGFSDERQKSIVDLARASLNIPKQGRETFVLSLSTDPDIVREALELAERLEETGHRPGHRIGTAIGRFLVIDYLGAGGAGEVYSAHDPDLGRKVAIKVLLPETSGLRGAEERFIREARAASVLNHPNIVTVHEVIRTGESLALVMELLQGVPLRQIIRGPLPLTKVLDIGEHIADALATAHSNGVVHGDIKPENVMMLTNGRSKLLDFGLARQLLTGQEASIRTVTSGIPGGTFRYMSPEHYKGQRATGPSDIFALGLVLYELTTGTHPFSGEGPLEILHAIAHAEVVPPSHLRPEIPALLESTIVAMLSKDPAKRPAGEEVAEALRRCQESGSEKPRVPVRPSSGPAHKPGRRWWWIAGCAAALFVAAFAAWRLSPPPTKQLVALQTTKLVPENRATACAISTNGKFLAYANVDGIFVRVLPNGETSQLKAPDHFLVDHLAWHGDGIRLLASGFSEETNVPAIWLVSVTGGTPRELRANARWAEPSPDDATIAYLSPDFSSIWRMDEDGVNQRQLLSAPRGDAFDRINWSFDGRFLLVRRRHEVSGTAQTQNPLDGPVDFSLESVDASNGRVADRIANFNSSSAVSRPDGSITLLGHVKALAQLYSVRMDPASGRFASPPQAVFTPAPLSGREGSELTMTRDGTTMAMLGTRSVSTVFVADFDRAAVHLRNFRRLTLAENSNYPHAWTADSKSVIFESDPSGTSWDLFKQDVGGRLQEPIVTSPVRSEFLAQLSPDGKSVLYAASANGARPFSLMRTPLEGGVAEQVPVGGPLDEFRCSLKGRCVVRTTIGRSELVYSELHPVDGIGRELARTSWIPSVLGDWDISPDGNSVAIPYHDSRFGRVRVINLNPQAGEWKERQVEIPGLNRISVVSWAADGSGWFVSIDTSIGRRIAFYDLKGRLDFLGDIDGWAVPSPDGSKVAFLHVIKNVNAWVINQH